MDFVVFSYFIGVIMLLAFIVNDLNDPRIFRKCLIGFLILALIGSLIEIAGIFDHTRGITFLSLSFPLIFLCYFFLLKKLYRAWKGTDPYFVSDVEGPEMQPMNGIWKKYGKDRKIMWADFLFSIVLLLATVFTTAVLAKLLVELDS